MLGRLEPAEASARPASGVEDRSPALLEQLRVVRVAPVDLDEQRPAVGSSPARQEDAGRLPGRRLEMLDRDAELAKRRRDVLRLRVPGGRAEGEPNGGGGDERDEEGGEGRARRGGFGQHRPGDAEQEHPPHRRLERPHEVRGDGEHDRGRCRDPQDGERRGVDPQAERVLDVGPVAEREACRDERGGCGRHDRRDRLEPDGVASGRDGDDHAGRSRATRRCRRRCPTAGRASEGSSRGTGRATARSATAGRRRSGREPDQRGDEQEDVGRAPEAGWPREDEKTRGRGRGRGDDAGRRLPGRCRPSSARAEPTSPIGGAAGRARHPLWLKPEPCRAAAPVSDFSRHPRGTEVSDEVDTGNREAGSDLTRSTGPRPRWTRLLTLRDDGRAESHRAPAVAHAPRTLAARHRSEPRARTPDGDRGLLRRPARAARGRHRLPRAVLPRPARDRPRLDRRRRAPGRRPSAGRDRRDRELAPGHRGGLEHGRGGDHPPREPDQRGRARLAPALLLGLDRDDGRAPDRAGGCAQGRPAAARGARQARRRAPRRGGRRPRDRHDRGRRRRAGRDALRRQRGERGRLRGRPAGRAASRRRPARRLDGRRDAAVPVRALPSPPLRGCRRGRNRDRAPPARDLGRVGVRLRPGRRALGHLRVDHGRARLPLLGLPVRVGAAVRRGGRGRLVGAAADGAVRAAHDPAAARRRGPLRAPRAACRRTGAARSAASPLGFDSRVPVGKDR